MSSKRLIGAIVALWILLAVPARAEISSDQASSIALAQARGQSETFAVSRTSEAINAISPIEDFYRLTAHGHFVAQDASAPAGFPTPSGTFLEVLVERESGEVRMIHLDGEAAAVSARRNAAARSSQRAHTATWGGNCQVADESHCYSIAKWPMSGSGRGGGEEVEGTVVETDTTSMNIPEWPSAIVNNEMWVAFQPVHYWLEIGTHAGYYVGDCCSLRWFYAKKNAGGYTQWNTSGVITPNTWPWYWLQAEGGGGWCWKIGEHDEATVACEGGFYTYSNLLEDGAEVGSESEPTNAGHVVTSYQALNGKWRTWNKAEPYINTSRMCQSQFQPYPGNINYGTC